MQYTAVRLTNMVLQKQLIMPDTETGFERRSVDVEVNSGSSIWAQSSEVRLKISLKTIEKKGGALCPWA